MLNVQRFQNKDLVLKISQEYDKNKLNFSKYEDYLDCLCGKREYQKDTIRETIRYFLGGRYSALKELAKENYGNNSKLQEKYPTYEDFEKQLQIPDKLSCSLDLATATGKSYVIYGIAQIMLSEGAVDQVLVLCPSNTIEKGLTEKFRYLSANKTLKDLLPNSAKCSNPRIINASQSITKGNICIENIHATYMNTKSAIEDSLTGKGERTLVLNDEAHHLANPSDKDLKKWKEFLINPKYNFKYIVGLSGTVYIGDEYFTDVIYRYSLKQAMEDEFVKIVWYVAEDTSDTEDERFQIIYKNHSDNKKKYNKIKPLTILVTKDISTCEKLTDKLVRFIAKKEKISSNDAEKKVLIVTSSSKHKENIDKLHYVDEKNNNYEWITSVSMLSEGWDVKNVFQIVPHEERAFNSKLLIAQVLGRGLRIPEPYENKKPEVTVFNHDKWSGNIKHLVDEILEIEKKVYSYVIKKNSDYNFELKNINYDKEPIEITVPQVDEMEFFKKGHITYSSQAEIVHKTTTYKNVTDGSSLLKNTAVEYKVNSANDVVQELVNKLKTIDMDLGTSYSEKYPKDKIKKVIKNSLEQIGEKKDIVSEENKQKTLQAFDVAYREATRTIRYDLKVKDILTVKTSEINKNVLGVASLRSDRSIFYDDYSLKTGEAENIKLLKEIIEDENLPKSSAIEVKKENFKTPLNVVFTASEPERKFVKCLSRDDIVKFIDSWTKSIDMGFYGIEFSWRKGEHPKVSTFNPDFFIKIDNDILVVEIKHDDAIKETDPDFEENKAKLRYAKGHFERLTKQQKENKYYFKFLTPIDYDLFFQKIRDKDYISFKSKLEAKLEEKIEKEIRIL